MKKIALILLLLASVSLGCKLSSLLPGSDGGGGSSGSSGGSSGVADPKADIIEASRKFIALQAFSAKMEGMGQTEIKSQVDYVAPDRYHVSYLGGTGAGMEMIMIGDRSFMKTDGKWSKMPGERKLGHSYTSRFVYRRRFENTPRSKIRRRRHCGRQTGACLYL